MTEGYGRYQDGIQGGGHREGDGRHKRLFGGFEGLDGEDLGQN